MADGAIIGRRAAIGQVAHTDGTATVVASLTLPTSHDGIYHVIGRVVCSSNTGTGMCVGTLTGMVMVDGGAAILQVEEPLQDVGATGYTLALTESGGAIRVSVTAANGVRSVALIEAFGVEMALTLA